MFNLGDKVRVVNKGNRYSFYSEWVEDNAPEYVDAYKHGVHLEDGETGVIEAVAKHCTQGVDVHLVSNKGRVALISAKGLELIETFKKSDLRTGMVTKFRNGVKSIVLANTIRSKDVFMSELLLVSKEYSSTDIEVYNEDLKHGVYSDFDIVEIRRFENADDIFEKYDLDNNYEDLELVWAREEPTQFIIGSKLGSDETLIWESGGFGYGKGEIIEVECEEGRVLVMVEDVVNSKIGSSDEIIGKVEL